MTHSTNLELAEKLFIQQSPQWETQNAKILAGRSLGQHMNEVTLDNRTYTVKVNPDNDMGEPWKEHDGHGIINEPVNRSKKAGELRLSDQCSRFYYDFAATMKLAKKDGWGLPPEQCVGLSAGEITAKAVRLDYERMCAWYRGDWYWVYVLVAGPDGEAESLGGIESDGDDYTEEVAQELAENLHAKWKQKLSA